MKTTLTVQHLFRQRSNFVLINARLISNEVSRPESPFFMLGLSEIEDYQKGLHEMFGIDAPFPYTPYNASSARTQGDTYRVEFLQNKPGSSDGTFRLFVKKNMVTDIILDEGTANGPHAQSGVSDPSTTMQVWGKNIGACCLTMTQERKF